MAVQGWPTPLPPTTQSSLGAGDEVKLQTIRPHLMDTLAWGQIILKYHHLAS
jgi:hypothetical protein